MFFFRFLSWVSRFFLSYLGLAGGEPRPATLFGKKRFGTDFEIRSRAKKGDSFFGRFVKKHAFMNILDNEFMDLE